MKYEHDIKRWPLAEFFSQSKFHPALFCWRHLISQGKFTQFCILFFTKLSLMAGFCELLKGTALRSRSLSILAYRYYLRQASSFPRLISTRGVSQTKFHIRHQLGWNLLCESSTAGLANGGNNSLLTPNQVWVMLSRKSGGRSQNN